MLGGLLIELCGGAWTLPGFRAAETEARVRTLVKQASSAKPIELDYSLELQSSGWKVFDIEVAGVSLVTNYRDSFGAEIRNNGIDGLIKVLQTKNNGAAADTGAHI